MDQHSFYLIDPDPDLHSEKLLDPDPNPQKKNADPQPWAKAYVYFRQQKNIHSIFMIFFVDAVA